MPALIDSLRRDHANMEFLLKVLEQEIAVFDRSDRPDFDIIEGVVDYFRCYPAQCHHPKEDLLFAKLKARGFVSPYLRAFVIARINPLRWMQGEPPPLEDVLNTMRERAGKFNTDKVKQEDLASAAGAPDEPD